MQKDKISIVLCTKDRSEELDRCLESIFQQTVRPLEIIVVDSSSTTKSREVVKHWAENINTIPIDYTFSSPGLTRQRNIGIKMSKGEIIAFFDDDVILSKGYLEEMINCFELHNNIYGATGYITNYISLINRFKGYYQRFFFLAGNGKTGKMLRSGFVDFLDPIFVNRYKETEALSGCNMLFRKEVFENFSFDEVFEGYSLMEDVEFSYRVSKKYKLMFVKMAKLVHEHSSQGRLNVERHMEMSIVNHYYVFCNVVKKSILDWPFFWWSHIGIGIKGIGWVFKLKNLSALRGFLKGHCIIFFRNS